MDAKTYYELENWMEPEPWKKELDKRVSAGEKWLDENYPDWYHRIDHSLLELSSDVKCVCGQVFATMWDDSQTEEDWNSGWDWFNDNYDINGSDLGFDTIDVCIEGHTNCNIEEQEEDGYYRRHLEVGGMQQYSYLTEEWLRRVEKKLANDPARNSIRPLL